jgi:glycogen(starch) synthase
MRILVVSNFYPPHYVGGYELGCYQIVEELKARGHEVVVLTSRHGVSRPTRDGLVYRLLTMLDGSILNRDRYYLRLCAHEWRTQVAFDSVYRRHRPELVYLWNLGQLPISLAFLAEVRGPVCYYISDHWLARWAEDPCHQLLTRPSPRIRARVGRRALRLLFKLRGFRLPVGRLELPNAQFCSQYLKGAALEAGQPVADAEVVHWGIDTDTFSPGGGRVEPQQRRKRLMFVGQVVPHKGVHTAIEALRLVREAGHRDATLTIVGGRRVAEGTAMSPYEVRVRELVAASKLEDAVHFTGPQPREHLPQIFRDHGILVFPSCWEEPFAITPLEAMASGLLVVGTTTGGSRELFEHDVNALTFPPENPQACADQLRRVLMDENLYHRLVARGHATVLERFRFSDMVDRIERGLHRACDGYYQPGGHRR